MSHQKTCRQKESLKNQKKQNFSNQNSIPSKSVFKEKKKLRGSQKNKKRGDTILAKRGNKKI